MYDVTTAIYLPYGIQCFDNSPFNLHKGSERKLKEARVS